MTNKLIIHENTEIPDLCKYMEDHWAKHFIEQGKIRLREIHDYQNPDHVGDTHDETQGIMITAWENVDGSFTKVDVQNNEMLASFCQNPTGKMQFKNCNFKDIKSSPRALSFCMSSAIENWQVACKMNSNYNTCVKISNVKNFLLQLADSLTPTRHGSFPFIRLYEVRYQGRNQSLQNGRIAKVDPDIYGNPNQAYQKEWRALFLCEEAKKDYFDIENNALCQYLEVVHKV